MPGDFLKKTDARGGTVQRNRKMGLDVERWDVYLVDGIGVYVLRMHCIYYSSKQESKQASKQCYVEFIVILQSRHRSCSQE